MAEWELKADSPFGEHGAGDVKIGSVSLSEITDAELRSLAFDAKQKPSNFPGVGVSTPLENGAVLLGMQLDQVWLFDEAAQGSGQGWGETFISDQSDSWAMVRLEDQTAGETIRTVLERLCPLDLHPDVFLAGRVERTQMEHLAVVIFREAENRYLLMSPRSSAGAFYYALETALSSTQPR